MYRIYEIPRREPDRRTLQADTATWAKLADDLVKSDNRNNTLSRQIKRDVRANDIGVLRMTFDTHQASIILSFAKLSA